MRYTGHSLEADARRHFWRTGVDQAFDWITHLFEALRVVETYLAHPVIPHRLGRMRVHRTELRMCLQVCRKVESVQRPFQLCLVHLAETLELEELTEICWWRIGTWCNGFGNVFRGAFVVACESLCAIGAEPLAAPRHDAAVLYRKEFFIIFVFDDFAREWRKHILLIVFSWTRIVSLIMVVGTDCVRLFVRRYAVEECRRPSALRLLL